MSRLTLRLPDVAELRALRSQVTAAKLQAQAMTRAATDIETLFVTRCRELAEAAGADMSDETKSYRLDVDAGMIFEEDKSSG